MKKAKGIFLILVIVIMASYIGIVITNNVIADKVEKDLVAYPLPTDTELVDSISLAGKLTGNGNGMQYMGAILVASNLSEEELKDYYRLHFDYIEVRKQENATLDFIHPGYSFDDFPKTQGESYYSITCWDDNRRETFGDLIAGVLDFDFRGH